MGGSGPSHYQELRNGFGCLLTETGGRVIVIGGWRGETAIAALAGGTTCRGHCGNPTVAVFACDVNHKICLHSATVIAAGTIVFSDIGAGRRRLLGMRLEHMLVEATLLNKALVTHTADMRHLSGVFLHVVIHGVLTRLGHTAMGANKLTGSIANVGGLGCLLGNLGVSDDNRRIDRHRIGS